MFRFVILLSLFALLVGCGPASPPPVAVVLTADPTSTPTPVPEIVDSPTATLLPTTAETNTPTAIPTTQPTETATPNPTAPPSHTPTATPTSTPTVTPSPTVNLFGDFAPPEASKPTPPIAYPTPAPVLAKSAEITNILLLGNDRTGTRGRTDSIMIASINKSSQTATLLSIPRDLFVYIPGWRMDRINLAAPHGGVELLEETIRYNLGIEIDHYLRLGFDGFAAVVDALDGVWVPVICPLEDWRLREPGLDESVEENWVRFKLDSNVYEMDGDLALWFARSRRSTNDFDRSRRQQQLLNAILEKVAKPETITQLPALYQAYAGLVETDLSLATMASLATLAPAVRDNGIRHLALDAKVVDDLRFGENQTWVQVLDWDSAESLLQSLHSAPNLNRAFRAGLTVEVIASNWIDYRLSAENLRWQGFTPTFTRTWQEIPAETQVRYHGPNWKGSYDWLMAWIYPYASLELATNSEALFDYTIELGENHNPCRLP